MLACCNQKLETERFIDGGKVGLFYLSVVPESALIMRVTWSVLKQTRTTSEIF